jgi:hypothetical protein
MGASASIAMVRFLVASRRTVMIDFVVWEDELSVDRNGEILDCVAENSADRFSLCGKTNSPNFVPPTHSKTANEWGTRHPVIFGIISTHWKIANEW